MRAEHFDVIVVGARCAGSPLATLLARAGLRVCVVDKARFPSDTPSTHGIQPSGVQILGRLGLREALERATTPIEQGTLAFDDIRIDVDDISGQLGAPMLNVRRVTLDAMLLDAAAAAGADVRTQTAVTGLAGDGDRVRGVTTKAGTLLAPLVVGADGTRSRIARLVGAAEYDRTPAGRGFVWTYFAGVGAGRERLRLGKIGNVAYLASPTDGDLYMAAVALDLAELGQGAIEARYRRAVAGWPELEETLAGATAVGPIRTMPRWHGYFRRSAGPGWVLVGDAGHFKDPTLGQGISDALRQSVALAAAIERAPGGPSADLSVREWWRWRDRDAREMYWLSHDMGAPGPTPLLIQAVQRRIAGDPASLDALLRVINHDLPPSKLFTARLAASALGSALRSEPGRRRTLLREARDLVANEVRRRVPGRPGSGPRAAVPAGSANEDLARTFTLA